MKLTKRLSGSGYMRRARQLKIAVQSLSGKKEEENKCIWPLWVAMSKKYVEKVKTGKKCIRNSL